MERLIVKNFGPLKDVDIELNKINLFIGENGSGKSVLGKLITVMTDFGNLNNSIYDTTRSYKSLKKEFQKYHINFLTKNSILEYYNNSEELVFLLKNESLNIQLLDIDLIINNEEDRVKKIFNVIETDPIKTIEDEGLTSSMFSLYSKIDFYSSKYIPAERNLISLFSKSLSTFVIADIPLPKFLLHFSSEYEKARNMIKELDFLNVKYINDNRDKIYYTKDKYLDLEHSSSGIQSALPLYLTVAYFSQKYRNIIIEELEQNLFPKAQADTIKYIVEQVSDDNGLFMMTHSPYVLSTLNTLMMAHKAGSLGEESKEEVSKLINEKQWINPNDFSAYYLKNGVARDIKGRTGLISENEIDEISDEMTYDFEELLTIYRKHKNDK